MHDRTQVDITEVFRERTKIDEALALAVQDALWRHKQLGHPVAVWRDGKVVLIPPEEIPVQRSSGKATTADWEAFEVLCDELSIDTGGERLTRDQLHDRKWP